MRRENETAKAQQKIRVWRGRTVSQTNSEGGGRESMANSINCHGEEKY